jgi:hypothetical protein
VLSSIGAALPESHTAVAAGQAGVRVQPVTGAALGRARDLDERQDDAPTGARRHPHRQRRFVGRGSEQDLGAVYGCREFQVFRGGRSTMTLTSELATTSSNCPSVAWGERGRQGISGCSRRLGRARVGGAWVDACIADGAIALRACFGDVQQVLGERLPGVGADARGELISSRTVIGGCAASIWTAVSSPPAASSTAVAGAAILGSALAGAGCPGARLSCRCDDGWRGGGSTG